MDVRLLSEKYIVKHIKESDVETVYALCKENPQYYQYCPPFVTMDSIRADMVALPPKKTMEDKFYIGFYDGDTLVAVMDLILKFPNEETAFVGFFMVNAEWQGKGTGTAIMEEAFNYLKSVGFEYVRLGFAKGNPQSEHFWVKNGFERTGVEVPYEEYTVVVMQRELNLCYCKFYEDGKIMNLVTTRCIIRNLTKDDANDLYEVLSNEEVMEYVETAFDIEQTREFIEEAGLCEPPLVYALEWKETGKVIGHVIFHQYEENSYEIGWIINRSFWGKGIADEVTKVLVEYAKELNVNSCVIECDTGQAASKHIALKNNFVYEGEDDGCDVYRLLL